MCASYLVSFLEDLMRTQKIARPTIFYQDFPPFPPRNPLVPLPQALRTNPNHDHQILRSKLSPTPPTPGHYRIQDLETSIATHESSFNLLMKTLPPTPARPRPPPRRHGDRVRVPAPHQIEEIRPAPRRPRVVRGPPEAAEGLEGRGAESVRHLGVGQLYQQVRQRDRDTQVRGLLYSSRCLFLLPVCVSSNLCLSSCPYAFVRVARFSLFSLLSSTVWLRRPF